MKKPNFTYLVLLIVVLFLLPESSYGMFQLETSLNNWKANLRPIVKAIIGLAALGGGLVAYFKTQSDEGGSGKKAIGNFALALIFGALMFPVIDFFME